MLGGAVGEEKGVGEKLKEMVTGEKEEEVTQEDLMREHGVLDRVLLFYEAGIRKWSSNEDFDSGLITTSTNSISSRRDDFLSDGSQNSVVIHMR